MQHLGQNALAERWQVSPRTLEQWRWQGRGPCFLKIGGRVVYRLSDVEEFEALNLHTNTTGTLVETDIQTLCEERTISVRPPTRAPPKSQSPGPDQENR